LLLVENPDQIKKYHPRAATTWKPVEVGRALEGVRVVELVQVAYLKGKNGGGKETFLETGKIGVRCNITNFA